MGGLSPRTSIIEQDVDTSSYLTSGSTAAILRMKLVTEDLGAAGLDFFYIDFGGVRVKTVDIGASYVDFGPGRRQGGNHFWTREDVVIDLTPYMDGTVKTLTFTTIDGARTNSTSGSNAFVDNVSIQAVPEPATMAALGLGAAALLRRRRRA
ncbi:PEP-CTERM sorting domain-containing protein [bacterium]|nr:MAG: PEP-CTERM sorting domain-containing protein [bacterium]